MVVYLKYVILKDSANNIIIILINILKTKKYMIL